MTQLVSPCTQRLNCTAPLPPAVAVEEEEDELPEPVLLPEPEPAVDVLEEVPVPEEEPPPVEDEDPAELDEPEPAGRGGPRLMRISLSIRAKTARANWVCSTTSRPICVWRSCTLIAM
jgi:hypothetical protein